MGRLRRDEVEQRRQQVLHAARDVLVLRGFEHTTMLEIAERCGASKETLYSWFGSKEGLFAEMIAATGADTAARLRSSLRRNDEATLRAFARSLLALLVSPWSVAVNRAAMTSEVLAGLVLQHGRHSVGPIVERFLAQLDEAGVLIVPDPPAAFTELFGLVVRDIQIRVLLGEPVPSTRALNRQADDGVRRFWTERAP